MTTWMTEPCGDAEYGPDVTLGEIERHWQGVASAFKRERDEARTALGRVIQERDAAIRETASCADELAFWKYQAIWQRAFYLSGSDPTHLLFDNSPEWKEAERQLEETRVEENQHRYGAT